MGLWDLGPRNAAARDKDFSTGACHLHYNETYKLS